MYAVIKDVLNLQKGYKNLTNLDTCTPSTLSLLFRDFNEKYHITDKDSMRIANGTMPLDEIVSLLSVSLRTTYEIPKWLVERPNGNVIVTIMKNKVDNTYSFVNLTKGHICKCKFATLDEAVKDMEHYKEIGKITNYHSL